MLGLMTVGTGLLSAFSPEITVAYIGVPINVVVACAAGAYASFSFGDKVEPRSRVFHLFFACIIIGGGWTGVLNWILDRMWDVKLIVGAQAGMGATVSCLTRFIMPELIKRIGPWLDKIPFLKPKKED